jgi:hypothetical protein
MKWCRSVSKWLLIVGLCMGPQTMFSQDEPCASDVLHEHLLKTDPEYARVAEERERSLLAMGMEGTSGNRGEIYTVPVVVHVIHIGEPLGEGTNISDVQIRDALYGLNRRLRNLDNTSVDFEIEFCLATIDPNGMPTNGITRHDFSANSDYVEGGVNVTGIEVGETSGVIRNISMWPWWEYLNIYVVTEVSNGDYHGYATYPTSEEGFSVFITYDFMLESYSLLTHEIGHTLYLYHTFEEDSGGDECPPNDPCNDDGDHICDTPPHRRVTCGETNGCSSFGDWNNSRRNYMSYCSERTLFTPEQYTRARYQLNFSPWFYLITSTKCSGTPFTEDSFTLVPNPSRGSFVIQSSQAWEDGSVEIYDTLGRPVQMDKFSDSNDHLAKFIQINVADGLYFIRIKSPNTERVMRFVVGE